jgi:hypothetical protein
LAVPGIEPAENTTRAIPDDVLATGSLKNPKLVVKTTWVPSGTSRPLRSRTSALIVTVLRPSATVIVGKLVSRTFEFCARAEPVAMRQATSTAHTLFTDA